jgi:hypothetical protein
MIHEENYCIVSCSSIGGSPLEEASEQERIPSIIDSIVWCCPTSRVSIIKLWFSIWFHISCVVIVFRYLWIYCDILYSVIWFLTSGIRALSLADIVGKYFLFFVDVFFREEKKGPRHSRNFQYIYVKNLQKLVVDLSSSQKNTQFEKTNCQKRSPRSQDIEVLKSAIFQGFFCGRQCNFFIYFCSSWRPNFLKKITYLSYSHNVTQFQKKNQLKRSPGSEVMSILNSTVFQGFSGKRRDFLQ